MYFWHLLAMSGSVELTKTSVELHLKTSIGCSSQKMEAIIIFALNM